jgi:hypothetical protein
MIRNLRANAGLSGPLLAASFPIFVMRHSRHREAARKVTDFVTSASTIYDKQAGFNIRQ